MHEPAAHWDHQKENCHGGLKWRGKKLVKILNYFYNFRWVFNIPRYCCYLYKQKRSLYLLLCPQPFGMSMVSHCSRHWELFWLLHLHQLVSSLGCNSKSFKENPTHNILFRKYLKCQHFSWNISTCEKIKNILHIFNEWKWIKALFWILPSKAPVFFRNH